MMGMDEFNNPGDAMFFRNILQQVLDQEALEDDEVEFLWRIQAAVDKAIDARDTMVKRTIMYGTMEWKEK